MQISVIIPMYNASEFISEAIESALLQTQTGEIILVDDGSTDKTLEICKKYVYQNKIIKLYKHFDNSHLGIAKTRNLGISKVTMPFFSSLDADDLYLEGRFEAAETIFNSNNAADGVYGRMQNFYLNDKEEVVLENIVGLKEDVAPEDLFLYLFKETNEYFWHCSLVLKTASTRMVLYDPAFQIGEDMDYMYTLCKKNKLFSDGNKSPVILRRLHDSNISLSSDMSKHNSVRFKIVLKWISMAKTINFTGMEKKVMIRRYLGHRYSESGRNAKSILRFFVKGFYLIDLLVYKNWLVKGLFKF